MDVNGMSPLEEVETSRKRPWLEVRSETFTTKISCSKDSKVASCCQQTLLLHCRIYSEQCLLMKWLIFWILGPEPHQAGADGHSCEGGWQDCWPELPHRPQAVRGQLAGAAEGGIHRPGPVCGGVVPDDPRVLQVSAQLENFWNQTEQTFLWRFWDILSQLRGD